MPQTKSKCEACGETLKFDNYKVKGQVKKQKIYRQCQNCANDNIPFSKITDNEFQLINTFGINVSGENGEINLFSPAQISHLRKINEVLKRTSVDNDIDDDSNSISPNCNYFSAEDFAQTNFDQSKTFSILHLNIHSVTKHIEEFKILLSILDHKFDIIALTESKLLKGTEPIVDITIDGYHPPVGTNTEASKGGVLLYVNKSLVFKPRTDIIMYSKK